jgi:hypothetical protein
MRSFAVRAAGALTIVVLAACSAGGGTTPASIAAPNRVAAGNKVGPGKILSTKDGGQIYGYDVDQNGTDGILASAKQLNTSSFAVSVETFDTKTATIAKSFGVYSGPKTTYEDDGIFENDISLVTRFNIPTGQFYPKRRYFVVNPRYPRKV